MGGSKTVGARACAGGREMGGVENGSAVEVRAGNGGERGAHRGWDLGVWRVEEVKKATEKFI